MQQWPATLFIALFIAWGIVIINVIAKAGGWSRLAEFYPAGRPFGGRKFFFQNARLRHGMSYNHVLTVGANSEGMYFSVIVPFRFGHPPLFIPWNDVSAEAKRVWWANIVILRFSGCPDIRFRISRRLADKLETASGVQFISEGNT